MKTPAKDPKRIPLILAAGWVLVSLVALFLVANALNQFGQTLNQQSSALMPQNLILITPGYAYANASALSANAAPDRLLTTADAQALQGLSTVEKATPVISLSNVMVRSGGREARLSVSGVNPDYFNANQRVLVAGRRWDNGERGVVITTDAAKAFGNSPSAGNALGLPLTVNSIIQIGGNDFTVVGIVQSINLSNSIYIPIDEARPLAAGLALNEVTAIDVILKPGVDPAAALAQIKGLFPSTGTRGEEGRGVTITTPAQTQAIGQNIADSLEIVVILVSVLILGWGLMGGLIAGAGIWRK